VRIKKEGKLVLRSVQKDFSSANRFYLTLPIGHLLGFGPRAKNMSNKETAKQAALVHRPRSASPLLAVTLKSAIAAGKRQRARG